MKKISVKRIIIEVLIGILIIILYCPNNIYYPVKEVYNSDYPHENVYFNSKDGTKLNAWYIAPNKNKPVILFSHGNGGNISYFFDMLIPFAQEGYGIFIYDYRGYGNSSGFPYENGLYNDLRGAVNYLNKEKNISDKDIILWGLSVGGGVTSKIANENEFKAVIFQSTFTNIRDMGKVVLKRLTHSDFFSNIVYIVPFFQNFNTYSRIDKITEPILITHSKDDELIPYEMAVKNAGKNKKAKLVLVNNDTHNYIENSPVKIMEFIKELN